MVKLDFNLERDVPELTGKVIFITGGRHIPKFLAIAFRIMLTLLP